MQIEVIARYNFSHKKYNEMLDEHSFTLYSDSGGSSCHFKDIIDCSTSLRETFEKNLKPLVTAFVSGFNSCLFSMGESNSGQNVLLHGHATEVQGLMQLGLQDIFEQLNQDQYKYSYALSTSKEHSPKLFLQSFFVQAEKIVDLQNTDADESSELQVLSTIEDGPVIKGLVTTPIHTVHVALGRYQEIMKRYFTLAYTLDGHANTDPAGFFLRVLFLPGSPRLKKSTLTFFSLTGVECLTDYTPMEEYQNPRIDGIRALYSLIDQLSSGPPGKREIPMYGLSILTRLLTEELGGNCCTRVILSIPPSPSPQIHAALLHMASGLTRITNAPVLNDESALLLASRYREMNFFLEDVFHRQHSNICGFPDPTRVPEPSAIENSQNLRYHIDDLNGRLQRLNEEVAHATEERVRISKLWLTSEEDRVIIADKFAASEVQIQELRIKNQELESIAAKALEASKRAVELKRANDLLNNYCSELYSKLDQCQNELEYSATQNEELSRELVHQMAKQKTLLNRLVRGTEDKDLQAEMENELKRIETMIDPTIASRNTPLTAKPRGLKPLEKDEQNENMKNDKPVNANKDLIPKTRREKQTKLMKNSELQSQIVVLKVERDKAHQDSEQSKKMFARFLDHFRGRLVYHINGITHLVESVKSDDQVVADRAAHGLRRYIRHLLTEMNAANKVREAQLLNVVERMDVECKVTRQAMKDILTAYIYLRSQAIENDGFITDLGTPPLELVDAVTRSMKPTDFNLNLSAMALAVCTETKRKRSQLIRAGSRFPKVSRKPQN